MLRQLVVVILGLGLTGLMVSPAEAISPTKRNAAVATATQQAAVQQAMLNQMMVAKKKRRHHHHRKPVVMTAPAVR